MARVIGRAMFFWYFYAIYVIILIIVYSSEKHADLIYVAVLAFLIGMIISMPRSNGDRYACFTAPLSLN
jgi:RsiW-degrading membrane proteinase PrsW (M82 family)